MLLLTNGDEVFGKLKNENERGIDLDDAMLITFTTLNGEPNLIFRKYCTYTNNFDIFFKREHIVAKFTDIREELIKSYEMTIGVYNEYGLPDFSGASDNYMAEFDMPDGSDTDEEPEFDDDAFYFSNTKKTVH